MTTAERSNENPQLSQSTQLKSMSPSAQPTSSSPPEEPFDPTPGVIQLFNSTSEAAREKIPRKPFEHDIFSYSQPPDPTWKPGQGATSDDWKRHETIEIDPFAEGRDPLQNFGVLASGVIPRPIAMVSTIDQHGRPNLSPCSYFNIVGHDPPSLILGFTNGRGFKKQTFFNILSTGEATLCVANEWIADAANYTAINAPPGVSEWALSGLTPAPSKVVKPSRVAECVFSIEAKFQYNHELISPNTGEVNGNVIILQAVYFHIRKDAYDPERNFIRPEVIRPISGMGGITWGRTTDSFEIKRRLWHREVAENEEAKELITKAIGKAEEGLKVPNGEKDKSNSNGHTNGNGHAND